MRDESPGSLLRFATAGSVDEGKSTLMGRLLYDGRLVHADQLEAVHRRGGPDGAGRGDGRHGGSDSQAATNLALLTDGLRAEREQGITIDVAYRYFATRRRRFILADTPGHRQYTRNMVTGASTAQLLVILVDVRNGVVEQTRRHAAVAALLRTPQIVLAVNKMDLVEYARPAFAEVVAQFAEYADRVGLPRVTAIPVSALAGDNVVDRSAHMDWYRGPTLMRLLETTPAGADPATQHTRFQVQYVMRPDPAAGRAYRGYAGQLASGILRVGDKVTVLPAGARTCVAGIEVLGQATDAARAPESITVRLADELDVSRGDLLACDPVATAVRRFEARVCHLDERPLRTGDRVLVKHGPRITRGLVAGIRHRMDLDTMRPWPAPEGLAPGDIGRVAILAGEHLAVEDYSVNARTGSCLLIDPDDGTTRTACMAVRPHGDAENWSRLHP